MLGVRKEEKSDPRGPIIDHHPKPVVLQTAVHGKRDKELQVVLHVMSLMKHKSRKKKVEVQCLS